MNMYANFAPQEVKSVLHIDWKKFSSDRKKFIDENYTAYNVALNTWLRLVDDILDARACRVLKDTLLTHGLADTIRECCSAADRLISGDGVLPDFCYYLVSEDEQATLQVLRYLKRFTPVNPEALYEASVTRFLNWNTYIRTLQPATRISYYGHRVLDREPIGPLWLRSAVKEWCHAIIGDVTSETFSYDEPGFSSGSTADCGRVLLDKLKALQSIYPNLHNSVLYPISRNNEEFDMDTARLKIVPVPKNYKTARIIAEMPSTCGYFLQSVRKKLERCLASTKWGRLIHLHDQGYNQEGARQGSITDGYSTIDLSGASDSISDALAKEVLPSTLYESINRWNPTSMVYHGKTIRRWIFQTSGNPTTFICESVIFLAVVLTAYDVCKIFTRQRLKLPMVYGDDLVVDSRTYDTVISFLELLGFVVNEEKSFGPGTTYRESCGAEYRSGIDCSTAYFPRKPIDIRDAESIASLTSLQHKLFRFTSTEEWLDQFLRKYFEGRGLPYTSSPIGTDCTDPWSWIHRCRLVDPPADNADCPTWTVGTENSSIVIPEFARNTREEHLELSVQWTRPEKLNSADRNLLDMYYYTCALREGAPLIEYGDTFSAYLAKLHHWTGSVRDYARDSGTPNLIWELTIR